MVAVRRTYYTKSKSAAGAAVWSGTGTSMNRPECPGNSPGS
jgi:hypothetical protein